jgi:lipoate-protein ligase A
MRCATSCRCSSFTRKWAASALNLRHVHTQGDSAGSNVAHWLRLRNVPILDALRVEEALFRADLERSWFITNEWDREGGVSSLTGRVNTPADAVSVVLGISGKPEELVHLDRARAANVPLCKRFSGGGTVIVDHSTIFVTFISAAGALPEVAPYPEPILAWTSGVYAEALRSCGVESFATHANDYCIGDRKFGGNAQSISGKRWLHHSSLLWDFESERMSLLRMPARRPEYRADRPHADFVRSLSDAGMTDRGQLMEAITDAVRGRFELREVGVEEVQAALGTEHRKVTREISYT